MRHRIAALALLLGAVVPALAQSDPAAMARRFGANQLGVMEYCQGQGFVGADAVAAQHDAMSRLPSSAEPTTEAEEMGKQGTLAVPNGQAVTLASVASGHGSTVEAMCKQMASAALQSVAAVKQNGMPGMPMMPAMPAMNGLQTMPGAVPTR